MKNIYILIVTTAVIFSTSCIKHDNEPCPTDFRVYGEVTPYDSVYHIGDTLILSCDYHYMVYETNTMAYYDLRGVSGISVKLGMSNIETISTGSNSRLIDFVDIIPNDDNDYYIQTFSNGKIVLYSNIILDGDTFRNEIKIVFKKKGLYILGYGPGCIENKSYFEGKCNRVEFNLFPRLNKGLDNNINLLALSPDEHYNNWILKQHPEQNFYLGGSFAYKVE